MDVRTRRDEGQNSDEALMLNTWPPSFWDLRRHYHETLAVVVHLLSS